MIKETISKTYLDKKVKDAYFTAGYILGDLLDFVIKGKDQDFNSELENFAFWEKTYTDRGYKTIPLVFISHECSPIIRRNKPTVIIH